MAELVKNRLSLTMRQQRGLAIDRRRQVAADQPEIRTALLHVAGDQRIHPCTTALVLARIPIRGERSEMLASVAVVQIVSLDARIPHRHLGLTHAKSQDPPEDLEH